MLDTGAPIWKKYLPMTLQQTGLILLCLENVLASDDVEHGLVKIVGISEKAR